MTDAVGGACGGLLLAPGAGGDPDHHTLVATEQALAPLPVRRVGWPYRGEGRRGPPPRAERLVPHIREQAATMCEDLDISPEGLVLGGRSMGGRVCSLAVAEGLPAAGLVLLSYPLHPPRRPQNLRVAHFGRLEVPCLFVSGDRDPFGAPEELETHTAAIPGDVSHIWLAGCGHDTPLARDPEVTAAVRQWLAGLG